MIRHLVIAVTIGVFADRANAQGTLLVSPADFQLPTATIDFESFPNGPAVPYFSLVNTQWEGIGVLIGDGTSADSGRVYDGTYSVLPHSGTRAIGTSTAGVPGGMLTWSFLEPGSLAPAMATEAGLWVENGDAGSQVSFFDRNNQLIRTVDTAGSQFFAGLRYAPGIGSIQVRDAGYFLVDDVQFGPLTQVPEPPGWILFFLLGGCLVLGRRAVPLRDQ